MLPHQQLTKNERRIAPHERGDRKICDRLSYEIMYNIFNTEAHHEKPPHKLLIKLEKPSKKLGGFSIAKAIAITAIAFLVFGVVIDEGTKIYFLGGSLK